MRNIRRSGVRAGSAIPSAGAPLSFLRADELFALAPFLFNTVAIDNFEGGRSLYKPLKVTGELYGLSEVIAELGRRFELPSRKKPAPAPEAPSLGTTTTPSAS